MPGAHRPRPGERPRPRPGRVVLHLAAALAVMALVQLAAGIGAFVVAGRSAEPAARVDVVLLGAGAAAAWALGVAAWMLVVLSRRGAAARGALFTLLVLAGQAAFVAAGLAALPRR